MHKKLSSVMALLIFTSTLLLACQTATPTQLDCAKVEFLCVGLVTGLGGIGDKAFNQAAWEGILRAQGEKVVDSAMYLETIDSKDYDQNITTLIEAGHDVIVTVGDLLGEATANAAKRYPAILFIGVDQAQSEGLPNLVTLVFHEDQSGFLAGTLAAQLTRTNTIASVLGAETSPSMVALKEGYEAGARYIKPDIAIISIYYPASSEADFPDPKWGANTAAQAIQNGADVVFGAGGITGLAALIETARYPGMYCIGVDTDQWETLPEAHPCLVSSAIQLITPGIFDLIKQVKEGASPTGSYFGATGLAPYHDFDSLIPQAIKDNINQVTAGLASGSITTGINPVK